MWHRDEVAVRLRIQDLRREAQRNALAKLVASAGPESHRGSRHNQIRSASAAAIRRLGRAIGLSTRLDSSSEEHEAASPSRTVAYR